MVALLAAEDFTRDAFATSQYIFASNNVIPIHPVKVMSDPFSTKLLRKAVVNSRQLWPNVLKIRIAHY